MVLYWSGNYTGRNNVSYMSPPPTPPFLIAIALIFGKPIHMAARSNAESTIEPEPTQHNRLDRLQTRKKITTLLFVSG